MGQGGCVPAQEGVEQQGRQGEVVDHLGFIATVAEVADVLRVGNVGFRDDLGVRRHPVQDAAEELDQGVGLGSMNAVRADFLPEVGHGVLAHIAHALADVEEQQGHHALQHLQAAVIQIHLVGAEGGPEVNPAPVGFPEFGQQGQGPGAHDGRKIQARVGLDGQIGKTRPPLQVIPEPCALGGDVVEHKIEHQVKIGPQRPDVLPVSQGGVDGFEVRDREAVIGGVGEEGQEVDGRKDLPQVPPGKGSKGAQGSFGAALQAVAVSDQHRVGFAEARHERLRGGRVAGQQRLQAAPGPLRIGSVNALQMGANGFVGMHAMTPRHGAGKPARLRRRPVADQASERAATPGSTLPSRNSRAAPPPVETWDMRSASPADVTAAAESPPPTTVKAPLAVN